MFLPSFPSSGRPPSSTGWLLRRRVGRRFGVDGLIGAFLVLGLSPLHAHRPTESTAEFRWVHARLEARVTFPLEMATTLLEEPEVVALGVENFPTHRLRLIERASDAFIAEVGGQRVRPIQTTAELTREGEVACVFVFPPHPIAALSVRALFLEKLPPDCFCQLWVWEGADRLLGRRLLVRNALAALVPGRPSPESSHVSALSEQPRTAGSAKASRP